MTEVLYYPKQNEILLFKGRIELNVTTGKKKMSVKIYLLCGNKSIKKLKRVKLKDIEHIGWL